MSGPRRLLAAEDDGIFEQGIHDLLAKLKVEPYRFLPLRQKSDQTGARHWRDSPLSDRSRTQRWMFLDVFEDGPAARSRSETGLSAHKRKRDPCRSA